jgi:hypothetical protein
VADLINSTNLSGGGDSDTGRVICEVQQATNPDDEVATFLWALAPYGNSDARQWLWDSGTITALGAPYSADPSAGESGAVTWPTKKVADDVMGEYITVPVTTADAKVTWNVSKAAIEAVRALINS